MHAAQIERHRAQAAEAGEAADNGSYSSNSEDKPAEAAAEATDDSGSLASDEQLNALRQKLAGN